MSGTAMRPGFGGTVVTTTASAAAMSLINTHALPLREPKPGWHGRFFDSAQMSFAVYELDAGASLHEHAHANEEVWNVVAGELEFTIGDATHHASAGFAAVVPSHTAHSVRALTPSKVIVVDHPLRGAVGGTGRAVLAINIRVDADTFEQGLVCTVTNTGNSRGVLRSLQLEALSSASLPPATRTLIPAGELPLHIDLGAGAVHEQRIIAMPESNSTLAVRGVAIYEDAAGERQQTTFARVRDASGVFTAPRTPGYNYGT